MHIDAKVIGAADFKSKVKIGIIVACSSIGPLPSCFDNLFASRGLLIAFKAIGFR